MLNEISSIQSDFNSQDEQKSTIKVEIQTPKNQTHQACNTHTPVDIDARKAFGFMPMSMKGIAIRWRGL